MQDKKTFFTRKIMEWGQDNYRDFIWRKQKTNFFTVFVAEFLLRRTRAESVNKFLMGFLKKYKSFDDLTPIPLRVLTSQLRALGLQSGRAKALKKIALYASNKKSLTYEEIMDLPHCGRYMANAIECFYRGRRNAIVDNNIQRVFNRYFSVSKAVEIYKADYLWNLAFELLPPKEYVQYNFHLLDFSALVCTPIKGASDICPIKSRCDFASSMGLDK